MTDSSPVLTSDSYCSGLEGEGDAESFRFALYLRLCSLLASRRSSSVEYFDGLPAAGIT